MKWLLTDFTFTDKNPSKHTHPDSVPGGILVVHINGEGEEHWGAVHPLGSVKQFVKVRSGRSAVLLPPGSTGRGPHQVPPTTAVYHVRHWVGAQLVNLQDVNTGPVELLHLALCRVRFIPTYRLQQEVLQLLLVVLPYGGDDAVAELVLWDAVAPQPTATGERVEVLAGLDRGVDIGLNHASRAQQGAFALAVLATLWVLLGVQRNVLKCQHAAQDDTHTGCKD